jgi:hypothetical protein
LCRRSSQMLTPNCCCRFENCRRSPAPQWRWSQRPDPCCRPPRRGKSRIGNRLTNQAKCQGRYWTRIDLDGRLFDSTLRPSLQVARPALPRRPGWIRRPRYRSNPSRLCRK